MSRLDEIKGRLSKAEPDEWDVRDFTLEATAPSREAFKWLLHAHADMVWLIAEVERLRADLAALLATVDDVMGPRPSAESWQAFNDAKAALAALSEEPTQP